MIAVRPRTVLAVSADKALPGVPERKREWLRAEDRVVSRTVVQDRRKKR